MENQQKNIEAANTGRGKLSKPVTSPISQKKLVSKVNALTLNSQGNTLLNPQNMVFNGEKSSTLNYKKVIDGLVKIKNIRASAHAALPGAFETP